MLNNLNFLKKLKMSSLIPKLFALELLDMPDFASNQRKVNLAYLHVAVYLNSISIYFELDSFIFILK